MGPTSAQNRNDFVKNQNHLNRDAVNDSGQDWKKQAFFNAWQLFLFTSTRIATQESSPMHVQYVSLYCLPIMLHNLLLLIGSLARRMVPFELVDKIGSPKVVSLAEHMDPEG